MLEFNVTPSSTCNGSNIIYTLSFTRSDGSAQANNFVTFDGHPSARKVVVKSTDPADVGTYTVIVTGYVSNPGQSNPSTFTQFTLTVIGSYTCATTPDAITLSSASINAISYQVNAGSSTSVLSAFTVSGASECSASDLVYSIDLGGADFASFAPETRTLTVATADSAKAGQYSMTMSATIINSAQSISSVSTSFTLTVLSCATT